MSHSNGLSPLQKRAVNALLVAGTIGEAAALAGVSRETVHRYLRQEPFRAELRRAEQAALDAASRRLYGMLDRAVNTLAALQASENEWVRLAAARAVLDYALRLYAVHNLEERLAALEGASEDEHEPSFYAG